MAAGGEDFVVSFAVLREPGATAGLRTELVLPRAWMVALEPGDLGDSEPQGVTTEALEAGVLGQVGKQRNKPPQDTLCVCHIEKVEIEDNLPESAFLKGLFTLLYPCPHLSLTPQPKQCHHRNCLTRSPAVWLSLMPFQEAQLAGGGQQ